MRLIDAESTKKLAQDHLTDPYHIISACAVIDKAETIEAVPVVRCQECKHFRLWGGYDQRHYCSNNKGIAGIVASTDFCSYGEKDG